MSRQTETYAATGNTSKWRAVLAGRSALTSYPDVHREALGVLAESFSSQSAVSPTTGYQKSPG